MAVAVAGAGGRVCDAQALYVRYPGLTDAAAGLGRTSHEEEARYREGTFHRDAAHEKCVADP